MFRQALPARPEARRLLLGTLIASIGQGMTLPFLFIYLHEVRHLSSTMVGLVVGWMGLLAFVLSGPGGAMIDRFGARKVMLPLYGVAALGVASYGYDRTTWQAFGSATLAALGGAVLWGGQATVLATLTSEEERQRVFGLDFAILNLGIGGGGVVSGFLADVHHASSFRLIYEINGVAALIPAGIMLSLPGIGHPVPREHGDGTSRGSYRDVFASRAFRRYLLFGLLITVSGYAQIEVGFPAFSSLVSGVETRVVAWGLAANTLVIVLAQLFVLRWLDGRSRSRALAFVGLIIATAWVILGLGAWGRHLGAAIPVIGVVLCAVVFACGETIMSPMLPAITNVLATDELRGRYNAMGSMIFGITGIIGPLTAAPLIGHHLGQVWIFLIVSGSLAASVAALSLHRLLTPEQDGRSVATSPAAPQAQGVVTR